MILKYLSIKNFRNFENVDIDLTNRNVIFGMNDIGKSNFLMALRFLFDRGIRKEGLVDTDFYNKDTSREVEITLMVELSDDDDDDDSKKIFKMMKGAIPSDTYEVYFQLKSTYSEERFTGDPQLYWGCDLENLEDIPSKQMYYEIDKHINVVYIDSSIRLENTFKKYSRDIFRKDTSLNEAERKDITAKIGELNESVSDLSAIKTFEKDLVEEYKKFRDEDGFNVKIKSEIEIGNLHSKLTPYILDESCETYPTSGDGRKKILAYTLLTLEHRRKEDEMINIFLIEELENHLHRSMQLALSHEIFSDKLFNYLFITTHSSLIVSQMDEVNLIKLVRECSVVGKSHIYKVSRKYRSLKSKLNQNLAEAIYADVVLLVEGPSEKVLFERVLNVKCKTYESLGGYILEVDGINFQEYYDVLIPLGVNVIVRTDNDLRIAKGSVKASLIGINRCLKLLNRTTKPPLAIKDVKLFKENVEEQVKVKRNLYDSRYPKTIKNLSKKNIFLSRVDLENDLDEVIGTILDELSADNGSSKNGVDFLQTAKLKNMIKLCQKMKRKDVNAIYKHERFECLRKLVDLCSQ